MPKTKDPDLLERASRALCRLAGNPENTKQGGHPMWEGYRNEAAAVLLVIREGDQLPGGFVVRREKSDEVE